MRNFRELHIWTAGMEIATRIYGITKGFPKSETYGLISQMNRAAVSIPSNIAEGCRGSDKELIHFLNISLGSAFELETQLILANKIEYIDSNSLQNVLDELHILQKRINAFRTKIKYKT